VLDFYEKNFQVNLLKINIDFLGYSWQLLTCNQLTDIIRSRDNYLHVCFTVDSEKEKTILYILFYIYSFSLFVSVVFQKIYSREERIIVVLAVSNKSLRWPSKKGVFAEHQSERMRLGLFMRSMRNFKTRALALFPLCEHSTARMNVAFDARALT